jgi:hypothetical protein
VRALTRQAGAAGAAAAGAAAAAVAEELTAPDDVVRAGRAVGVGAPGAKSSSL